MKSVKLFALSVVFASVSISGICQTQRFSHSKDKISPSQFPLTLHVTGSHFSTVERGILFVEANQGTQKLKLETNALTGLMSPGDYKARLASRHQGSDGTYSESYELLFPNGTHLLFFAVGESI